jgi:nucleoside-diphosphate-sugar epimerase
MDPLASRSFYEMCNLSGRRVLVSGASGFVGANLSMALVGFGAEVHALIRPGSDLWRIRSILPSVALHRVDILDGIGLQTAMDGVRPEYIFHLATGRAANTPADRRMTLQANVLGLLNLLEAAGSIGYRKFVCAGGSMEYGHKDHALNEQDLPEPVTFYAATKAAATLLCRQHARANGRPVIILRLFSVYGYWEAHHRLIPTAMLDAMHGREIFLTVPGFRRDMVFVDDVVDACLKAAFADAPPGEIVNIGTGQQWTNEQVVSMIGEIAGRPLAMRAGVYPARESDTTHWVADIGHAARILDWRPHTPLRQGLEKTMVWLMDNQQVYLRQQRGETA